MLVADYLNILKREIGVKEGPNNKVKYSDELHEVEPRIDRNAPWCQAFLSWGKWIFFGKDLKKARASVYGYLEDFTQNAAGQYKNAKRWGKEPAVGADVFFKDVNGNINHVGCVLSYDESNIYTIEGNSNNMVRTRVYPRTYPSIAGYGYPSFISPPGKKANVEKPAPAKKESFYYTVKKGDTLTSIAKANKTTIKKLVADNGIKNKNLIFVGQKILINY